MAWEELRDLALTVRPLTAWPGIPTRNRQRSPFRAGWRTTTADLARELRALDARHIVLGLALRDADLRIDGYPRAHARAEHPGITLAFDSRYGPLRYATDAFTTWQDNLRAVALGLEALRKVDRYGVSHDGEQYRGYRELEPARLTQEEARTILRHVIGDADGLDDRTLRSKALKAAHPDLGGDPVTFEKVRVAVRVLQT